MEDKQIKWAVKGEINMNYKLKMLVHEIIDDATHALKLYDKNDEHWEVLLSLLRFRAEEYIEMYKEKEEEEEEVYYIKEAGHRGEKE